jgi:hypothetical protein
MSRLAFALTLFVAGAAAAAKPTRAVLLPIAAVHGDAAENKLAATIESALIEGLRKLTSVELLNLEGTKLRGGREPKGETRPQARGQTLARELGAELAIVAEPQPLGEGAVVYLQVVEASGKVRGSTTVAITADALHGPELERPLRGGVVQIVDPPRFVGRAELRIDVKGAEVIVDGRKVADAMGAPVSLELPVGPHALRVTHPAYRDYLRFIEVAYDRTAVETIAMAAFPLTEGEMAEKRRQGGGPVRRPPWYRSWWALTITGVVLAGATAGIVYAVRPGVVSADQHTTYKGRPGF